MTDPDDRRLERVPLTDLLARRHPGNVKAHDLDVIDDLITRFGFTQPVLLDERSGLIAAGHGRLAVLEARRAAGGIGPGRPRGVLADGAEWLVPTVRGWSTVDDDELMVYVISDNRSTEVGGWTDGLGPILAELDAGPAGLPPGFTSDDLDAILAELVQRDDEPDDAPAPNPPLAERFVLPPFTILDARSGAWQDRKRRWMTLGIRSEIGRADGARAIKGVTAQVPGYFPQKAAAEKALGRSLTIAEFEAEHLQVPSGSTVENGGVSVFDPVLCELAYRWFCPPAGLVFDPFAGGSVRGVVAAALGRRYVGVELSGDQVAANAAQWAEIRPHLPDDAATPAD